MNIHGKHPAIPRTIDEIDVQNLVFPTDKLTIGQVRKTSKGELHWRPDQSHYLDRNKVRGVNELFVLIRNEQEFAYRIICNASNIRHQFDAGWGFDLPDLKRSIANGYVEWGLAEGRKSANLLLGSIEEQALTKYGLLSR